tara:strand:- start:341 stop:580 length:240 start_codon:yes stop_codon:yes gene_type:complete
MALGCSLELVKHKNQEPIKKTTVVVNALERSSRKHQAQIKNLQSDKELLLALLADNEISKTKLAQTSELSISIVNVASK